MRLISHLGESDSYGAKLVIVDDFYPNPNSIVEFADTCDFEKNPFFSTGSLVSKAAPPGYIETLMEIGAIITVKPDYKKIKRFAEYWGYGACGNFQLRLATQPKPGAVHSHTNGGWVGIVYLASKLPSEGTTGTHLLRHKTSGLQHLNQTDEDQYQTIKEDKYNLSAWEDVGSPSMVFNRLVIFDSRHFHAESYGFGTSVTDGRLIQIFNFTESEG